MTNLTLKRKVSYLTLSDIHTLNDSNETAYITQSLSVYFDDFSDKSKFKNLDIIFLAGDIFDYYKNTKDGEFVTVLIWMSRLMSFCQRHGIKLRVLEGTPSHDWKQSKNFEPLARSYPNLDYRYIEVLSIEQMEDLGLSVLYVPDEWGGSAQECKKQVIELMRRHSLETVSIACMHGMFDFQIPDIGEHPLKHDSDWYQGIVERFINIGHDHVFKVSGRIIVQGSFDRIAHGEEGKKGGVICHIYPNRKDDVFEFVENKRARTYKTVSVKGLDLDKCIEQVRKVLDDVPAKSHVRISASEGHPIFTVFEQFRMNYPDLKFKRHKEKSKKPQQDLLRETIDISTHYVPVSITSDNIIDLVLKEIDESTQPKDKELLISELEPLL